MTPTSRIGDRRRLSGSALWRRRAAAPAAVLALASALLAGCLGAAPPLGNEAAPPPDGTVAPPDDILIEHDYGAGEREAAAFTIPDGAPPATLHVLIRKQAPPAPCVGAGIRLLVEPPAGEDIRLGADAAQSTNDPCFEHKVVGASLPPGEWRVTFEGRGTLVGVVSVTWGAAGSRG